MEQRYLDQLDQVILVQFCQLRHEVGKFTSAVILDQLTAKEQEHYAKMFRILADSLDERAARTRKRASKGNVSDINSARGEAATTQAG